MASSRVTRSRRTSVGNDYTEPLLAHSPMQSSPVTKNMLSIVSHYLILGQSTKGNSRTNYLPIQNKQISNISNCTIFKLITKPMC
jgi:hypothetical protein